MENKQKNDVVNEILKQAYKAVPKKVSLDGNTILQSHNEIGNIIDKYQRDESYKKLIQLRAKLDFYKKLKKKIDAIMNAKLELEDYSEEIYRKIDSVETELDNHKLAMNLPDEEWDEDETHE